MDHFSYLIDRQHRLLLIGIIVLVMAAASTLSGAAFRPYHGLVYRAEDPKHFWWNVVGWVFFGLFFIALYLLQNAD
jgi:hypothetical protein